MTRNRLIDNKRYNGITAIFGLVSLDDWREKNESAFLIQYLPSLDTTGDQQMQHMATIDTIGSYIGKLSLTRTMASHFYGGTYEMNTGYVLGHLFRQRPNLTNLRLNYFHLVHCNPNNMFSSSSITHLTLDQTNIHKGVLLELSV